MALNLLQSFLPLLDLQFLLGPARGLRPKQYERQHYRQDRAADHESRGRFLYSGPAGDPPEPADPTVGTGHDWLASQPARQVVRQELGRFITSPGDLRQALQADGLQVARHFGVKPPWRNRLVVLHLHKRLD